MSSLLKTRLKYQTLSSLAKTLLKYRINQSSHTVFTCENIFRISSKSSLDLYLINFFTQY